MTLETLKSDLAKKIMETNNHSIINHIKAIFDTGTSNWFEELPLEVQASVERGLKQSESGQGKPHKEVMRKYSQWLKK